MTPKETALMTIDCHGGHMQILRALISADAPLDDIINKTRCMCQDLSNSVQLYIADRQGFRLDDAGGD